MKAAIGALCCLLAMPPAVAGGWARPLLWRIDRPDAGPVHLLGTIHLPLTAIGEPPGALREVIDRAEVVVTEIPLDGAAQADLLLRAVQPAERSLADDLPPDLVARLRRVVAARGLQPAVLERFRPWAVLGQLATIDWLRESARSPMLDQWLWQRAGRPGVARESIETVAEQVAAFESFSNRDIARLIGLALDQLERTPAGHRTGEELLAAFREGDPAALIAEFSRELAPAGDLGRRFRRVMLDRRNERMARRIARRLEDDRRSQVIAIGALHLAGAQGVLARLEAAGWHPVAVEPLVRETAPAR